MGNATGFADRPTACLVPEAEGCIRAWEDGSSPLASAPLPQTEAVIAALRHAGACRLPTEDLTVAAWCDLIIAAVAASEDVTSVLADPIATEDGFGELMAWCLDGRIGRLCRTGRELFEYGVRALVTCHLRAERLGVASKPAVKWHIRQNRNGHLVHRVC